MSYSIKEIFSIFNKKEIWKNNKYKISLISSECNEPIIELYGKMNISYCFFDREYDNQSYYSVIIGIYDTINNITDLVILSCYLCINEEKNKIYNYIDKNKIHSSFRGCVFYDTSKFENVKWRIEAGEPWKTYYFKDDVEYDLLIEPIGLIDNIMNRLKMPLRRIKMYNILFFMKYIMLYKLSN